MLQVARAMLLTLWTQQVRQVGPCVVTTHKNGEAHARPPSLPSQTHTTKCHHQDQSPCIRQQVGRWAAVELDIGLANHGVAHTVVATLPGKRESEGE